VRLGGITSVMDSKDLIKRISVLEVLDIGERITSDCLFSNPHSSVPTALQ
jgi:hypothetical protein